MSTIADDSSVRQKKTELETKENGEQGGIPDVSSPVDFNRLYGDLYNKLLNTPVQEIFPHNFTSGSAHANAACATGSHEKENGGSPKRSIKEEPVNIFSPTAIPPELLGTSPLNNDFLQHGGPLPKPDEIDFFKLMPYPATNNDIMEKIASTHEPIDIPKLVEDFRVTLEAYGVSQRFAARFIMQDTSQGNLSFLMEKGKTKTWEELSIRGRIPYIKMKVWLENKDQQIMTLEMIKQQLEMKKYCSPKEPYNRRERFSMYQLQVLCNLFEESSNPPMHTRSAVAQRLNIPLDRVNVWFQNQRARGFPAKKILQNSVLNESVSSETSENGSTGRYSPTVAKKPTPMKEKNFLPMSGPIVGDPFALLKNFTASKLGEQAVNSEKSPASTPLKPESPLISGVNGVSLLGNTPPIDFTSFPFTTIPLRGQSTPGLSDFLVNQNMSPILKMYSNMDDLPNNHQNTGIPEKSGQDLALDTQFISQAGSSKRKRGKVPRQIVRSSSPLLPDEWKSENDTDFNQSKRVKTDEGSESARQSDKHPKNLENGKEVCALNLSKDMRSVKSNQKLKLSDVIGDVNNMKCDADGKPIPKETLVAIKSVCAHLLVEDKEKEKTSFEEPDLD